MKQVITLLTAATVCFCLQAQNLGVGTTEPLNKLQVEGSLLVNTPTIKTSTAPTAAQEKTMVNASTVTFSTPDSTGRIYDPGGPAANYPANITAFADIFSAPNCIGIELDFETMQLNTGDSLFIKPSGFSAEVLMAVGNGYTTTGKRIFNNVSLHLIFKSNADASTGIGFSLLFKRLYSTAASLPDVSGAIGNILFFDVKKGAFRSGLITNNAIGPYSTSMGRLTTASGDWSIAMGNFATASGSTSTAIGSAAIASGNGATAIGGNTTATGGTSTAIGNSTTATGNGSTAIGIGTTAEGNGATAMGNGTSAGGTNATAMGENTIANGIGATAMGRGTTASGTVSTAMGQNTTALGINATAMGSGTNANGDWSTTMGNNTTTFGSFTTAMGVGTLCRGFATTVIGMYNNPILAVAPPLPSSTMPLFIIGNGDNPTTLSNALTVLKSGNVGIGTDAPAARLHVDGNFRLGNNGSTLNEIIKSTETYDIPSLAPGAVDVQTFAVANAQLGSAVSFSPLSALPDGITISYARVSAAGVVEVKVVNAGNATQNPASMSFYVGIIR
jgi:Head domain of trimeric autotransporter adhesin